VAVEVSIGFAFEHAPAMMTEEEERLIREDLGRERTEEEHRALLELLVEINNEEVKSLESSVLGRISHLARYQYLPRPMHMRFQSASDRSEADDSPDYLSC